jgi:hypothetical protein
MKATDMKPTALREYLKRLNTQAKLEGAYGDPAQARLLQEEATAVRWYLRKLPTAAVP